MSNKYGLEANFLVLLLAHSKLDEYLLISIHLKMSLTTQIIVFPKFVESISTQFKRI